MVEYLLAAAVGAAAAVDDAGAEVVALVEECYYTCLMHDFVMSFVKNRWVEQSWYCCC